MLSVSFLFAQVTGIPTLLSIGESGEVLKRYGEEDCASQETMKQAFGTKRIAETESPQPKSKKAKL